MLIGAFMARRQGPAERSLAGCIAVVIVVALFASAGPAVSLVIGGLLVLAGFGQLGDRRRDPMTGVGLAAIGVMLFLIGLARMTGGG